MPPSAADEGPAKLTALSTPPNPTNLADQLPAQVYHHLIHTLRHSLPPPLTDSPEDLARRNHAAIARIAALAPANAAEAEGAALYVAASDRSFTEALEKDTEARDRAGWTGTGRGCDVRTHRLAVGGDAE